MKTRFWTRPVWIGLSSLMVICAYTLVAAFPLLEGPHLTAQATFNEDTGITTVRGSALRVSRVSINDAPIPINEVGDFSIERAYPPGYTVIVVQAEDRFGRTREKTLTLVTTHPHIYASEETDKGKGNAEGE